MSTNPILTFPTQFSHLYVLHYEFTVSFNVYVTLYNIIQGPAKIPDDLAKQL
jgi:hypothetical protein